MNGYNFTERVRKVLAMSREEAAALHHEYVGTEHMLLAVIREGQGVAATTLQNLSLDPGGIRERVLAMIRTGRGGGTTGPDLPYTSRAKKVLELAMSEARRHRHSYVGTEHLLLGMLAEEKGVAAQVLTDVGVTLEKAREEVLRILGTEMPGREHAPDRLAPLPEGPPSSGALRPVNAVPESITVELRFADGTVRRRKCLDRLEAMRFLVQ